MQFQNFTIIVEKDDPMGWHSWIEELPGCHSCGDTPEEAKQSVLEAAILYLEELKSQNQRIQNPTRFVDHITFAVPV